jgi:hypothetical protein
MILDRREGGDSFTGGFIENQRNFGPIVQNLTVVRIGAGLEVI